LQTQQGHRGKVQAMAVVEERWLFPEELYGETKEGLSELVAEACGDGDLVAALGAAAIEYGCTGLGLHAGEKAVGLGAVAAVGLEGTLRHD